MNIAVIGRSHLNFPLQERLASEGFTSFLVEDIDDIKGFKGQKGEFVIDTCHGTMEAGYVIVTQEAERVKPMQEASSLSLLEAGDEDIFQDNGKPIVFVLDFPEESPGVMTRIALEKGTELAKKKRKVVFLARFIRTAGDKLEKLYKEARNAGVTFIKYKEIQVEYLSEKDQFDIQVTDDFGTVRLDTAALLFADRVTSSDKIHKIAKTLRLKQDDKGFIGEGNPYLYPTFTNRKGIFVMNNTCGLMLQDDMISPISFTLSSIRDEMMEEANKLYAVVDTDKCAFCYTCYRICPHAAMAPDPDDEKSAMKNLQEACYGCGICVSLCPGGAISLSDDRKMNADRSKTLKVFCCENSADIAITKVRDELGDKYEKIETTAVSCGGEISVAGIILSLRQYDKVLVAVCIDDACKHFEGNKRAYQQVERARQLLKSAGLDENRISCVKVAHTMPMVMADTIYDLVE